MASQEEKKAYLIACIKLMAYAFVITYNDIIKSGAKYDQNVHIKAYNNFEESIGISGQPFTKFVSNFIDIFTMLFGGDGNTILDYINTKNLSLNRLSSYDVLDDKFILDHPIQYIQNKTDTIAKLIDINKKYSYKTDPPKEPIISEKSQKNVTTEEVKQSISIIPTLFSSTARGVAL